jgi:hypothetical protein
VCVCVCVCTCIYTDSRTERCGICLHYDVC